MTDRCRFVATDQPRVLPGRHRDQCESEACSGCLPCPMDHCRCCGIEHSTGACPGCIGSVRDDLAEVVRMHAALPSEVEQRGIDGEAMMLLGPSANPEAWGHVLASIKTGRLPSEWQEAGGELHPLFVLAGWEDVYRDTFDQGTDERAEVHAAADYLDHQLTNAAAEAWVPFEDMARDIRRCRAHLEAVLHDGEQVDRGVPCLVCHKPLERTWAVNPKDDGWRCRTCRTTSTKAMYELAVRSDYIASAAWLTAEDMELRSGVKASTVRSWAADKTDRPTLIRKKLDTQRVVFSVEDVLWINACRQHAEHALSPCA